MSFLMVCIMLIILAIYVYAAMKFAQIASEKGYENEKTTIMILCIFLPPAGYLLVCAMPDLKKRASIDALAELMRSKTGGQADKPDMGEELPDL